jgi:hypothetical protein
LTHLGPLPVIVGLSLGASRKFALKRKAKSATQSSPNPKFPAPQKRAHESASYLMKLPHNSLVIMWPPCQEEWLHAVPKMAPATMLPHPISGTERISLTFRESRKESVARAPKCRCGTMSVLKSAVAAGGYSYYFTCDPAGSDKPCGFWQAADDILTVAG